MKNTHKNNDLKEIQEEYMFFKKYLIFSRIHEISYEQILEDKNENISHLYVDLRNPDELQKGIIPNSITLDQFIYDFECYPQKFIDNKDLKIIFYSNLSLRALLFFKHFSKNKQNFLKNRKFYVLIGGFYAFCKFHQPINPITFKTVEARFHNISNKKINKFLFLINFNFSQKKLAYQTNFWEDILNSLFLTILFYLIIYIFALVYRFSYPVIVM